MVLLNSRTVRNGLLSCYGHQVYTLEVRTYRGGEEVQDVVSGGGGGRLDVRLGSLKVEGAELRMEHLGRLHVSPGGDTTPRNTTNAGSANGRRCFFVLAAAVGGDEVRLKLELC